MAAVRLAVTRLSRPACKALLPWLVNGAGHLASLPEVLAGPVNMPLSQNYFMLNYAALCKTILHYATPYYAVLYYTILYCRVLYCTILLLDYLG